jgi:iron complex transport system permease protein
MRTDSMIHRAEKGPEKVRIDFRRRRVPVFIVLAFLLVLAVLMSLGYGVGIRAFIQGLFSEDGFGIVLRRVRLPRTIMAVLVGGSLAVCGVTLQSILRNPLAEPYTLGISGGASLGVVVAVMAGIHRYLGAYANPLLGFLGALCALAIVYSLSRRRLFDPNSMVLFGVVVSLVFSSLVFFIFSILDPDRMQIALMWLMGDLSSLEVSLVPIYIPLLLIPTLILFFFGSEMDLLSLGAEKAHYLGVDPPRTYRLLFVLTSVLTGLSVSAAGIIGFVGLIVPHILRRIVGPTHRTLLVASYLGGAFFLVLSDFFSRYLLYPVELPAGVVTGMLGGFVLLLLLVRRR